MPDRVVCPGRLKRTALLLLALLAIASAVPADTVEVRGTVMEVAASRVKIACDSEQVPSEGDAVRIGFELGGELIPVAGTWKVVEAGPDFSWAARDEGGVATASAGYVAVISSPKPITKAEAAYLLGGKYRDGRGVEVDKAAAFRWFLKAAEMGHASAQWEAAWAYQNGFGVERNDSEAFRLYRLASDRDLAVAQSSLGYLMLNGRGTPKDEAGALALFRKAAAQGYTEAVNNIGGMHEFGMGGLSQNFEEAMKWYVKASNGGYGRATRNMGRLYEQGIGVKKDVQKARELYRKAADQGYGFGLFSLAESYWNSDKKKDKNNALEIYREAADKGVQEARDWLKNQGYDY